MKALILTALVVVGHVSVAGGGGITISGGGRTCKCGGWWQDMKVWRAVAILMMVEVAGHESVAVLMMVEVAGQESVEGCGGINDGGGGRT